jgi:hypothetical protein
MMVLRATAEGGALHASWTRFQRRKKSIPCERWLNVEGDVALQRIQSIRVPLQTRSLRSSSFAHPTVSRQRVDFRDQEGRAILSFEKIDGAGNLSLQAHDFQFDSTVGTLPG